MRTIGIPINRMPSVVGILSPVSVLYQQRFPRPFLEFSHSYTYRWTEFKHGSHRWWYSSNFYCRCRAALLSATETSTGSVRKRQAARWIRPSYGSSSSANVGSGNRCVVIARDDHLSAEALQSGWPSYVPHIPRNFAVSDV